MTLLEVNDLHAGYSTGDILKGISFRLEPHSLTGLLGTNGCGKTTLMKAVCGTIPYRGSAQLAGREAGRLSAREISRLCRYIPQRTGIAVDISALEVVLMGFNPWLGLLEYPSPSMRQAAMDALGSVGLADRANDNFLSLSEGQKQLCILCRALMPEGGILLLDEPESALDFSGRYRMLHMVRSWVAAGERAALVTLHDPQLAINTCDTLLLLQDGKIAGTLHPAADTPEEMEEQLCRIYGSLSVRRCLTRSGSSQFVLLKEGY